MGGPGVRARRDAAGKRPGPGQCYAATILPVFEGGTYDVDNLWVAPSREWLGMTGSIHQQLQDVGDGEQVVFRIGE
ncbi:hypothetical protein [Sphingomonas sp.]|uniref:hypothetical protein n=1 Tax=Sphingomonas sp. TaxID=28214 RepID=UPI001B078074|nr:hypothetical protein [Sphingomonas sp.]MBO9711933.1 hypothetical protein [Sphingomonas sp.]